MKTMTSLTSLSVRHPLRQKANQIQVATMGFRGEKESARTQRTPQLPLRFLSALCAFAFSSPSVEQEPNGAAMRRD
jgi:hypothetical protein